MLPFKQAAAAQQQPGSIRGVVYDADFDVPLAGVLIAIVETGLKVTSTDEGSFVISGVPPGKYTLTFSKDDYVRQVKADVVVQAGQLTDVDASLAGEFTEMDEFVVQDIVPFGAGTEAALLNQRFESPALMDSISSELMSRAGASDAASALRLVAGASVADGNTAVIRGLPDRYVSSQMNGVRLPSADEDKRAVELDQFPAAVIESIQVSKTFTPDQQGDASGGAVNVQLKTVPQESFIQFGSQVSVNSQVWKNRDNFLTYDGGGVNFLGQDDGDRDIQYENIGGNWDGAVGVTTGDAPIDYKWGLACGGMFELDDGVRLGGLAAFFYERDSSYFDDGVEDNWWVDTPGEGMVPETNQGTPTDGDFKTALFDVTQGSQSVQWGGLAGIGLETELHSINFSYLYTHIAEDTATLAEDTRGKEYFFPDYDPDDPTGPGNQPLDRNAAPYIRLETLEYTERTADTLQFNGEHTFPIGEFGVDDVFTTKPLEFDWIVAFSSADLNQPDKRQFGSLWLAESINPIFGFTSPETYFPYKPAANFNLGNFQRIWKEITEDSQFYAANVTLPFDQWSEDEGYLKTGLLADNVDRDFDQDTFSNFGDSGSFYEGDWEDDSWSTVFGDENHPITASNSDVDYTGTLDVSAWYAMMDLPLESTVDVIGGARVESTDITVVNDPEADAVWFPPGSTAPADLNPGDADVDFSQVDLLPALGVIYEPLESLTLRASYAETVARQTFKELTPIIQQEFLGGPIFIGNPDLGMSSLQNFDLRADYTPFAGGLLSASLFYKDIQDPIEYVQKVTAFTYTTAVNYPEGWLSGVELEARQDLGQVWEEVQGVSLGANATFINSQVTLPADEAAGFDLPGIQAPMSSREMTNAPDYLFNAYITYDLENTGTEFSLFYTLQGDTLVAGAGQSNGNLVPNVYALPFDTLNLSVSQALGQYVSLIFQAKNLTNPVIEEVYRSPYIDGDVTKSSYTQGVDYSLTLSVKFSF